ncbi:hypothetical protein [Nitrosomonas sp. Nm34]|uniref:hypothetical protein n=1 Tax=Nitrosomonas sp. Nm34 TaxID=1881055 RepID=UPI0008E1CA4B|nr:hypothetical protein [Nitrosomonas sp. Nm34]SFI50879.1 hypothetical protein SAMN05428978_101411 [Nitrosomonas sp. Nm34]
MANNLEKFADVDLEQLNIALATIYKILKTIIDNELAFYVVVGIIFYILCSNLIKMIANLFNENKLSKLIKDNNFALGKISTALATFDNHVSELKRGRTSND